MSEPTSLAGVLRWILTDPWDALGRRWNYKSALLSAAMRASVFLAVNLSAGLDAAVSAGQVEFVFRFATAGFYGALTQAFRRVDPPHHGTAAAGVLLPVVAHTLEYLVHRWHGTPALAGSIAASIVLTAVSTSFNLFAMRRGALVVGDEGRSLASDLAAMPRLFAAFVAAIARSCVRSAW
jgi:hypothetical protein